MVSQFSLTNYFTMTIQNKASLLCMMPIFINSHYIVVCAAVPLTYEPCRVSVMLRSWAREGKLCLHNGHISLNLQGPER